MAFCQVCIRPFNTMVIKLIFECRWQKNVPKYSYFSLPATKYELLSKTNLLGLVWTCASVFDFWLISLAAVETIKTPSRKLQWILSDVNGVWYNGLYFVTLNLICQYTVMSVDSASLLPMFSVSHFVTCCVLFQYLKMAFKILTSNANLWS